MSKRKKDETENIFDCSPNSIICDYNTFVSADLLFSKYDIFPIWDNVHCFANILEAIILSDKIFLPFPDEKLLYGQILPYLQDRHIIKILDSDSEPIRNIRMNPINFDGKQYLYKVAEWVNRSQSEINNFDHYFPIFACNTWRTFDGEADAESQNLWGRKWDNEIKSCISSFLWGVGDPPKSILMPQLAMGFLLRGFIYNELSKEIGVSYIPHPFRGPIVLGDALSATGLIPPFTNITSKWMNNLRTELLKKAGGKIGKDIFELNIPSLFTVVLRESDKLEDCIKVALQLRDTESARQFRKWATTINRDLRANRSGELIAAIRSLDTVASNMKKEFGIEKTEIGINLWLFKLSAKIPRLLHKPVWIPPHLRFIRDTVLRSYEIVNLRSELERLGVQPKVGLPF